MNSRNTIRRTLFALAVIHALPLAARAQAVETYFNRNTPMSCQVRMRLIADSGDKMLCVAYPPGANRWSIITEKGYVNQNVPTELHAKMGSYVKAGHELRCVAFPPAGGNRWSLITDRGFFNRNVPAEMHSKMLQMHQSGARITWVAFPPAGGNSWSIVTDKGTFFNRNIPSECHAKMQELAKAGHKIRCVAFPKAGGNRWSVVTDKGFFNRATPYACHRVMRAMIRFPGGPLQMVAFPPNDGFTVVSAADPNGIPSTIDAGTEYLSLDRFALNLRTQLDLKGVKWAFTIRKGSATQSYASGWKRVANTPPAQLFSIYDRLNPASVSKTVTGVAVLRALQERGVSIDEYIYKYLPTFWTKPRSMRNITFKQLLNHTSGFRSKVGSTKYGFDYDSLRAMVAAGINQSEKVYDYENVNYALARIVCVYLDNYQEAGVPDHGAKTAKHFTDFVQKKLMDPCGIPDVEWRPDAVEPTLFYPDPIGSSKGTTYGDFSYRPGSAGCHLSMAELNIFLAKLHAGTAILNTQKKTEMNTHNLGWGGKTSVKHGFYYRKGGYFPGSKNGGAELHSYICQFSNGIQVSAVINGDVGIDIKDAYDQAWKKKALTISSVTASIANVTKNSLLVTGQNLDLVDQAVIGTTAITSRILDPTKAYLRSLSSTRLLVHLPQGLEPGSYPLQLLVGRTRSPSFPVQVVRPAQPTLLVDSLPTAGRTLGVVVSAGRVSAQQYWLLISDSPDPSKIPGIFHIDIGRDFQSLFFILQNVGRETGASLLNLPSLPVLRGQNIYLQAMFATRTFPLAVSNVGAMRFR